MDFIENVSNLYLGNRNQAYWMAIVSVLCFAFIYRAFRSDSHLMKGTIAPILIMAVLYGIYSFMTIKNHTAKVEKIIAEYKLHPEETISKTLTDTEGQMAGYAGVIKKTWPIIFVVGLLLYLIAPWDLLKGIGIGLIVFAILATIGDYALMHRAESFLELHTQ